MRTPPASATSRSAATAMGQTLRVRSRFCAGGSAAAGTSGACVDAMVGATSLDVVSGELSEAACDVGIEMYPGDPESCFSGARESCPSFSSLSISACATRLVSGDGLRGSSGGRPSVLLLSPVSGTVCAIGETERSLTPAPSRRRGVPQRRQKRASWGEDAPQFGQTCAIDSLFYLRSPTGGFQRTRARRASSLT